MITQHYESQVCSVSGESPAEEWANFLTHGFGLFLSIIGFIFLISSAYLYSDSWITFGCFVYGTTLILMFCTSTLYHSCKTIETKKRLRVMDHVCIYLLIAGSYTPFIFGPLKGSIAWILCLAIWGTAFVGSFLKIFYTGRFVLASTGLYLLMGWGSIFIVDVLKESLSDQGFMWLAAGGISYTLGVIFFLWEKLPFNHCIWHLFVMGGSACHYYVITFYIALK